MRRGGFAVIILIIIVFVALIALVPISPNLRCAADSDCVPAQCCHPVSCVHFSQKPDCTGIVCSLECRAGTMDCGQGRCACQDGECQAVIESSPVGLPNPASVYCEEQGYELEIRTDQTGGQYGVCIFPDGSECEEWEFYKGDCIPGMYMEVSR